MNSRLLGKWESRRGSVDDDLCRRGREERVSKKQLLTERRRRNQELGRREANQDWPSYTPAARTQT